MEAGKLGAKVEAKIFLNAVGLPTSPGIVVYPS
jgi:hypothetical protein